MHTVLYLVANILIWSKWEGLTSITRQVPKILPQPMFEIISHASLHLAFILHFPFIHIIVPKSFVPESNPDHSYTSSPPDPPNIPPP